MASQGTTLRFQVEVAADQAQQALKAMTVAFNQAGVQAKAAMQGLGGASRQAATDLEELKKGAARSREAMMYLTSALGEMGPAGRAVQSAVTGIAGAILGGGGLLLALEGARLGVRYLAGEWDEEGKAAEEAKKKNLDAAEAIVKAARARAQAANEGLISARSGATAVEAKKALDDIRALQAQLDTIRATSTPAEFESLGSVQKLRAQIQEVRQALLAANQAIQQTEALRKTEKPVGRRAPAGAKATGTQWYGAGEDEWFKDQARLAKEQEARDKEGQRALDERARAYEKQKEAHRDMVMSQIADYQRYGEAAGSIIGGLVTGQLSLGEAMAQVGQMVIQSVVQSAIAQVQANAVAAASGAASSQAAIPVAGPVLAISAMGAMLTAVMGLLANLPSAAGGWMVPHDTLAMVHQNERILPARYSEGLDRLVNQGGGGITVNISAADAKSVRRLFLENTGALAEAIGRAARDGRRFG